MNKKYFKYIFLLLIFTIICISIFYLYINPSPQGLERSSDNIYVAEGRSFIEINSNTFEINRTVDLNGTSIDIKYSNETNYLYGTVGATNKLHVINKSTFEIDDTFHGHTHNVQSVTVDKYKNNIYTTSTDQTVRKINLRTLEEKDIFSEYSNPVMDSVLSANKNILYTAGFNDYIHKINTTTFESEGHIEGFPEDLQNVIINDKDNIIYYGGNSGGLYALESSDFEKYDNYSELPEYKYTNLEYDVYTHEIENYKNNDELIESEYNPHKNVIYIGGSSNILYEVDADTLEVKNTYNVTKNRTKKYDYSKYSFPAIQNGIHIYEDNIRGVSLDKSGEYIYITTAPGSVIEINAETFEQTRTLYTFVDKRTVDLDVV